MSTRRPRSAAVPVRDAVVCNSFAASLARRATERPAALAGSAIAAPSKPPAPGEWTVDSSRSCAAGARLRNGADVINDVTAVRASMPVLPLSALVTVARSGPLSPAGNGGSAASARRPRRGAAVVGAGAAVAVDGNARDDVADGPRSRASCGDWPGVAGVVAVAASSAARVFAPTSPSTARPCWR